LGVIRAVQNNNINQPLYEEVNGIEYMYLWVLDLLAAQLEIDNWVLLGLSTTTILFNNVMKK
jgi:hypothetical protein